MAHSIIFGGTFDPIHHGHLITAQAAREQLAADEVILVPAYLSPHKLGQTPASGDDRIAMARLAVDGIPGFQVCTREIERGGTSYTIDTVEALQQQDPDRRFTLLIGADQLPKLHTWHRVQELLAMVGVAVLGRLTSTIIEHLLEENLGPATAERLKRSHLETPLIQISATEIRARVAAGQPVHFLVPPAVENFIRQHHLYRTL
jgi:nicotinate-nucleotide adenylyltransferase